MNANRLRIIGGKWRSRTLTFTDVPELRPTPDRVRETLFNWLQTEITGRRCLDCFAGSGALSFEALSRGAQHAVMLESSPALVGDILKNAQRLGTDQVEVIQTDFPVVPTAIEQKQFDLVFLDPPFSTELIVTSLSWLLAHEVLSKNAFIYLESDQDLRAFALPSSFKLVKEAKAGQVRFGLLSYLGMKLEAK